MQPGDYITVNPSEVEILTSDAFKEIVSADVARKIGLTVRTGDPDGYTRMALPKIGKPVADALLRLATPATPSPQAVVAEHLAERIEERIALSQKDG